MVEYKRSLRVRTVPRGNAQCSGRLIGGYDTVFWDPSL